MSYRGDLRFVYHNPTRIVFGEGVVKEVGREVAALGGTRALVITDKGIVTAGLAGRVEDLLGPLLVGIYDGCIQDSGLHVVNEAAAYAREISPDTLVSIGGGSVIDTAKGVALLLTEGGDLEDYTGYPMLTRPQTPHIAIPTTAGTGSEVTYAAVIKDWRKNVKTYFLDDRLIPDTAMIDPQMTRDLPPQLTATTGMDALCHAVESIHSLAGEPVSDAMALQSIRLIMQYLPRCVERGDDLTARGRQQLAAAMAGIAFSNAQVGLVHAMAHAVGARHQVPHGLAVSVLLPHVMRFNLKYCAGRYALMAGVMGLEVKGLSKGEAAEAVVAAVSDLTLKLGVPQRLRDCGVPGDDLVELAGLALADGAIIYNPRRTGKVEKIAQLFREAW